MIELLHDLSPRAIQLRITEPLPAFNAIVSPKQYKKQGRGLLYQVAFTTAIRLRLFVHVVLISFLVLAMLVNGLPTVLAFTLLWCVFISVGVTALIWWLSLLDRKQRMTTTRQRLGLTPELTGLFLILMLFKLSLGA